MTHGSLFSGIGGFDLAAEWMGWENKFHCEINPFGRKILKHYWPNSVSHEDATTTDWNIYRGTVDIVSGGDPCQGNSVIGKMEGDKYKGYMWPAMFGATARILPGWLVNENVAGSISNGILDRKIKDLQSIGYTCWPPILIPASYVGANHKRERVLLVAYSAERRLERRLRGEKKRQWKTTIGPIETLVENKNGSIMPKPEFLRGNDGLSSKLAQECIKGFGNAIVPQVAFEIFKSIEQYEFSSNGIFK